MSLSAAWGIWFGLGVLLALWLEVANLLSTKVGLRVLRSDLQRINHYHVASGAAYCLLMLLGLSAIFALGYVVRGGSQAGLIGVFWGLAAGSLLGRFVSSRES